MAGRSPVPAGDSSATGSIELGAYVDADQRYMIVSVLGRDDALHSAEGIYPRADLYVACVWAMAGPRCDISMRRSTAAPTSSRPSSHPTKRYLYFTSERGSLTEHGTPLDYDALEATLHASGNGLGDIDRIELSSAGILRWDASRIAHAPARRRAPRTTLDRHSATAQRGATHPRSSPRASSRRATTNSEARSLRTATRSSSPDRRRTRIATQCFNRISRRGYGRDRSSFPSPGAIRTRIPHCRRTDRRCSGLRIVQ